jgi:hypothetical protein
MLKYVDTNYMVDLGVMLADVFLLLYYLMLHPTRESSVPLRERDLDLTTPAKYGILVWRNFRMSIHPYASERLTRPD